MSDEHAPSAGPADPDAPAARMPVTVLAALAVLAVSVVWGVLEVPAVVYGLSGPSGVDALAVLAIALTLLPLALEITALVGMALGRGWARWPLLGAAAFYLLVLLSGGSLGAVITLAIALVAFVLASLPPSRAWFAARAAHRRS